MVASLNQKEYLTYFDAVQEVTNVLIHGIENVKLEGDRLAPINRFSAFHARIVGLGRLLGALVSKKKRLNRQKETDQKIARLAESIAAINACNKRLIPLVTMRDRAESLVSANYYTLRAARLHNDAFALYESWNVRINEDPEAKKSFWKRFKLSCTKFVGLQISNAAKNLTFISSEDGKLAKTPLSVIALGKMTSISYMKICQQQKGFAGGKRGFDPINHTRLQLMGGFRENAENKAKKVLKNEKLNDTVKSAFENVSNTAGDSMALEEYMEAIALNTFKGAHDQLELSEGILHFKTTIGQALAENFKKVESFDLLFPLFQSAQHHFCHNQTSTLQAIHTLMADILKPYAIKYSAKVSEADLKQWLDQSLKTFPNEQTWIKGLFFEEVVRTLASKEPAKLNILSEFSVQHLLCENLTEAYVKRKLQKVNQTK